LFEKFARTLFNFILIYTQTGYNEKEVCHFVLRKSLFITGFYIELSQIFVIGIMACQALGVRYFALQKSFFYYNSRAYLAKR